MKLLTIATVALLLFAQAAGAQTAPAALPAPDYMSQAVAQTLTEAINQELYWRSVALKAQADLAQAQADLKKLNEQLTAPHGPIEPAAPAK